MTLRFTEWDKAHYTVDESLGDDIQNWLGKTFGGKTKKIDGILADLGFAEKEYAKEWEKTQMDMGSLKGQIESGEISPEEEKDFRKKIKEHQSDLASLLRRKTQKIRDLNDLAMKTVEGNSRLQKYWDLKKAEAELEIVENLYKISKNLPDKKLEDDLYSQYKKAYDRLKQKEKGAESVAKEVEKDSEETTPKEKDVDTSKIGKVIAMNLSDFKDEVKKYSPEGLKTLQRALIDQKNLGLNELRSLRRAKGKELDRAPAKEKTEILGRFNPKIYEIGERIDKIREKINHIDG
jgi:hypothetical protein